MIETSIFKEVYDTMYSNSRRREIRQEVDEALLSSIVMYGYLKSEYIGDYLWRVYNWIRPISSTSWGRDLNTICNTINSIGDYDRLV